MWMYKCSNPPQEGEVCLVYCFTKRCLERTLNTVSSRAVPAVQTWGRWTSLNLNELCVGWKTPFQHCQVFEVKICTLWGNDWSVKSTCPREASEGSQLLWSVWISATWAIAVLLSLCAVHFSCPCASAQHRGAACQIQHHETTLKLKKRNRTQNWGGQLSWWAGTGWENKKLHNPGMQREVLQGAEIRYMGGAVWVAWAWQTSQGTWKEKLTQVKVAFVFQLRERNPLVLILQNSYNRVGLLQSFGQRTSTFLLPSP